MAMKKKGTPEKIKVVKPSQTELDKFCELIKDAVSDDSGFKIVLKNTPEKRSKKDSK